MSPTTLARAFFACLILVAAPSEARFLQVDPVGYQDRINLYAYVGDDPLNHADPTGQSADEHLDDVLQGRARGAVAPERAASSAMVLGNITLTIGSLFVPAERGLAVIGRALGIGEKATAVAADGAAKSTVGLGPHAGESIAARSSERSFTTSERQQINRIGSETGCHSCGTTNAGTKAGNFVPDHQPPSALNPNRGSQRLYPQCLDCSRKQGLEIARKLKEQ